MERILNFSQSKLMTRFLRTLLLCEVLFAVLLGCSDTTGPTRDPRNTFADWQHIQGKVCGVWTKDHNPHVITAKSVYVEDGDSLVVKEGVEIVASGDIELVARGNKGYLKFLGTQNAPIRWTLTSGFGALYTYGGNVTLDHVILEGNQKMIGIGGGAKITNSIFSESGITFMTNATNRDLAQKDSVIIRSCIFAGFRSWDPNFIGSVWNNQDFGTNDGYLDSSLTEIRNNLFYGPIGDSLPAGGPIVDVRYKGASGIRSVTGVQWPGNGNIYGNPLWASYTYIGPSPTGLSSNDYHLQPGSPALGTGADGSNIGVY